MRRKSLGSTVPGRLTPIVVAIITAAGVIGAALVQTRQFGPAPQPTAVVSTLPAHPTADVPTVTPVLSPNIPPTPEKLTLPRILSTNLTQEPDTPNALLDMQVENPGPASVLLDAITFKVLDVSSGCPTKGAFGSTWTYDADLSLLDRKGLTGPAGIVAAVRRDVCR